MGSEEDTDPYQNGLEAIRSGNYLNAVEILSEYVEIHEEDHKAWNALGIACDKLKKYNEADICFENALSLSPDNQIYLKNRSINSRHVTSEEPEKQSSPLNILSFFNNRRYCIGGGVAGVILLLVLLFFIGGLFSPHSSGTDITLSAEQTDKGIIVKNLGGADLKSLNGFSWKVNNKMMGTGTPMDIHPLGVENGSSAQVSYAELADQNVSSGIQVTIVGNFKNGSSVVLLNKGMTAPVPVHTPLSLQPVQTPVPAQHLFKSGDVVYNPINNEYLVILNVSSTSYSVAEGLRRPNLSWTADTQKSQEIRIESLDSSAQLIGGRETGQSPLGLTGSVPPQVADISSTHPMPVYMVGDIIRTGDAPSNNVSLVILGYDNKTDQYQADELYPYYQNEWGYRSNTTPDWYIRSDLEQNYKNRSGHVSISDIGIGPDSSPPKIPPRYTAGDIIGSIPSSSEMVIVRDYNPSDDTYQTQQIERSYDGNWVLTGDPVWEKRLKTEREYPYHQRHIDLSLVR